MKPENVLLSAKLSGGVTDHVTCKLGDVGLAALRSDPSDKKGGARQETTKVGKAGTYPYIAPETLLQVSFSVGCVVCRVWGVGCERWGV